MKTIKTLERKYHKTIDINELDLIIAFVIKKPREFLYTHPEQKITLWQSLKIKKLVSQRRRGIPIAYLFGRKEFFGLDFLVNKNTLVPRPETELLVEEARDIILRVNDESPRQTILIDVGTGSGCIPISIVKNLPLSFLRKQESTINTEDSCLRRNDNESGNIITIFATDISTKAILVARQNAKKHGVEIIFRLGNLLEPVRDVLENAENETTVIITANLPYGWKGWTNEGAVESLSLKYEPQIALFTNKNGLQLYEELLIQIKKFTGLKKYKITCLFEFDPRQTEEITQLINYSFPNAEVEIKKDLAGRDRLVVIHLD